MFKVKKAFEHGHQVLLVALQSRNYLNRCQAFPAGRNSSEENDHPVGESDVSILAHLIRSDDEMLINRFEQKKELIREWEAIQKRKERSRGVHEITPKADAEFGGRERKRPKILDEMDRA